MPLGLPSLHWQGPLLASYGLQCRSKHSSLFQLAQGSLRGRHPSKLIASASASASAAAMKPYTAVMIVPTGTGAAIGGFAGDALPVARAMASVADRLITHPNVLNAAMLYWPSPNICYVEGYALDRFAEGEWGLELVHANKVGLALDSGIEDHLRWRHLQVSDATRASLGLPVIEYVLTDTPLEVRKWIDPKTGQSTGSLENAASLMRSIETLVSQTGINAIAVVSRFPDDSIEELENYRQGQGVDALAGVEAIISHMVVREFQIPCAHAPALQPLPLDITISPRSAAEEIGYTFLPSVLVGLSRAPQFIVKKNWMEQGHFLSRGIWAEDVYCVVVPINACGGDGTIAFGKKKRCEPLLIAVEENETVLDDTPEKLELDALRVANYWEAIGVMAAHKSGVDPWSLRKHGIKNIRQKVYSICRTKDHSRSKPSSFSVRAEVFTTL